MKKLIATIAALTALNVSAATLYLDDGTQIDLPVGSRVYIDEGTLWSFTRFESGAFDIRAKVPTIEVGEQCQDGFTFGGNSGICEEVVEVQVEPVDESCGDGFTFGGSSGQDCDN